MREIVLLVAIASQKLNAESTGVAEVEICDFGVSPAVAEANTSFTMAYSFSLGPGGVPRDITRLRGAFLQDAPFVACLAGWKLNGQVGEKAMVEFDWVHMKGWTRIRILGKTTSVSLRIAAGALSYPSRSAKQKK